MSDVTTIFEERKKNCFKNFIEGVYEDIDKKCDDNVYLHNNYYYVGKIPIESIELITRVDKKTGEINRLIKIKCEKISIDKFENRHHQDSIDELRLMMDNETFYSKHIEPEILDGSDKSLSIEIGISIDG